MQRSLLHAGAWTLATGAAVTLSWFGVHTVLRATAYDPPRALPVAGAAAGEASPQASSTHRPRPSPTRSSPSPSGSSQPPERPSPERSADRTPSRAPQPQVPSHGRVEGYTTDGGRVVFDLRDSSASLVSATPNSGWQMQVWKDHDWIRVTFTPNSGGRAWSVHCTWNGHPPQVQTYPG